MSISKKDKINSNQLKDQDLVFIKKAVGGEYVNKFISAKEYQSFLNKDHYTYEQNKAIEVWTINHKLNKEPSVMIEDINGEIVEASITIIDNNSVRLEFSKPFRGKAHLN